jgi:16S rRNA (cytosine967-C5)-methyltransferase
MDSQPTLFAASLIAKVDRQHPADVVLRDGLRANRGIPPPEASWIAGAVFGYFRWRGWLDERQPLSRQVDEALQLAVQFKRQPMRFPDAELMARAVPDWTKQETDVTPEWARALQAEPKLWLRARPGQGGQLAEKLGDCRRFGAGTSAGPSPASTAGARGILEYHGVNDLFRTPEFHHGEFELQDLNSQAVGFLCDPRPGQTWWDACAGEGGKTLHLSDLMENQGLIWATDRAAWRLQKLRRRAARARVFNYRTAVWDEGPKLPTKTKFDGVLVDAPCSGMGTWQRNPHARWTTTAADVAEMAAVQQSLLLRSAAAVKPGGKLVYAVCTLARSETIQVAEAFERQAPEFTALPVAHPLDSQSPPRAQFFLLPQEFGGNGMFIAVWQRRDKAEAQP